MDDEQTARQQHLVPEAIKAIRAELMQREPERPPRPSPDAPERKRKPASVNRAG